MRAQGRPGLVRGSFALLLLWILAALLVRGVFGDLLTVFGVRPDLLTIVIVYWALAARPMLGTLGGFLAGLMADVDLGRDLGVQAGLLSLVGFLIGHAGRQLIRENPFLQGALVALAVLAVGLGRTAVQLAGQGAGALVASLPWVLGAAAYSALLGPALYWLACRVGLPDPLARGPAEE